MRRHTTIAWASFLALFLNWTPLLHADAIAPIFNVKNYGASGEKTDDARKAIQKASTPARRPAEARCCCRPASTRREPSTSAAT